MDLFLRAQHLLFCSICSSQKSELVAACVMGLLFFRVVDALSRLAQLPASVELYSIVASRPQRLFSMSKQMTSGFILSHLPFLARVIFAWYTNVINTNAFYESTISQQWDDINANHRSLVERGIAYTRERPDRERKNSCSHCRARQSNWRASRLISSLPSTRKTRQTSYAVSFRIIKV